MDEPKTLSVPEAGKRYFDLSPNASYIAARKGHFPVIRMGGKLRVSVPALEKMLQDASVVPVSDRRVLLPGEVA
jgi:hypothetical protein